MTRGTGTFAEWQLERFRLGELTDHEQEVVATAVDGDASLRRRLEALDRDDREILVAHPPEEVADAVRARLAREASRTATETTSGASRTAVRGAGLAAAAASAVVAAILLAPRTPDPVARSVGPTAAPRPATPDATRVKGSGPRLLLYRQAPEGPEPLADGAPAHARDVIQVLYVADGQRFGVVASIDGRGVQSLHLPTGGPEAAELDPDGAVVLASAWELDDAPAFERFFFVTSPAPFAVDTVTRALRRAAAPGADPARLDLPDGLAQSTFVLRKDASR
jgi:hypothetical protein